MTPEQLLRVHTAAHLARLDGAFGRVGGFLTPRVNLDADTVVSPGTQAAARRAAGLVVAAVDEVISSPRPHPRPNSSPRPRPRPRPALALALTLALALSLALALALAHHEHSHKGLADLLVVAHCQVELLLPLHAAACTRVTINTVKRHRDA